MNSNFQRAVQRFFDIFIKGTVEHTPECVSAVNHYTFYQSCIIPALILTLMMACTKSRRAKLLDYFNGRPGLIYPMDTLTSSSRISYCCAFGCTAVLVYQILLEQKFAIDYTGPISLATLIAALSMLIYGVVFFPVFASLAMRTAFSYSLGAVYVWIFLAVNIFQLTECDYSINERVLRVIKDLPSLLCLGYLSVSLPLRFVIACQRHRYFWAPSVEDPYCENIGKIKASFQGRHVTRLLRKQDIQIEPTDALSKVKAVVLGLVRRWIYHRHRGFRYPSRFVSVLFIGGCVVYVITVEFLTAFVPPANYILNELSKILDAEGWTDKPQDSAAKQIYRFGLILLYTATNICRVSMLVSVCVACLITLMGILHMMTSFRTNLFAMYRGDYSDIPPPTKSSAPSLCVGSIKFAGFQVAYIVWGYIVQFIVLFIICVALGVIICLLIVGITDWLINKVFQLWPGLAVAIVLMITQTLLARYVFLQSPGTHLRLDNRRFYFIFTFFMFFYNIFLGLFSCLMRILKAIGLGTLFLARLDNSTLSRKHEFLDPGFNAYQGYIHMEAAHTHPVVNVFIRLLFALRKSRQVTTQDDNWSKGENKYCQILSVTTEEKKINKSSDTRSSNIAARFNWHVVYTLLHNPSVRIHRRGYIEAVRMARQKGLKIPISDKLITDFDLVQLQDNQTVKEMDMLKLKQNNNNNCFTNLRHKAKTDLALYIDMDDVDTKDSDISSQISDHSSQLTEVNSEQLSEVNSEQSSGSNIEQSSEIKSEQSSEVHSEVTLNQQ